MATSLPSLRGRHHACALDPVIENNLIRYGPTLPRVRATDIPVLALDDPSSNARAQSRRDCTGAR